MDWQTISHPCGDMHQVQVSVYHYVYSDAHQDPQCKHLLKYQI